jgi:hypothetical protein
VGRLVDTWSGVWTRDAGQATAAYIPFAWPIIISDCRVPVDHADHVCQREPDVRDVDRAERIGEFWGRPESHTFAELLIECEEDQTSGRCWSGCCGRPKRGR